MSKSRPYHHSCLMRILSGDFKGQAIEQPKTAAVRPISQKARAAIFDVLGDITGFKVLDLYAGSGGVGLESLSRGASQVILVEKNPAVCAVINRNVAKLGVGNRAKVINRSVEGWVNDQNKSELDLIIADPPYVDINSGVLDQSSQKLSPGGILVVSHTSKIASPELKSLELAQAKVYGDSALSFYRLK